MTISVVKLISGEEILGEVQVEVQDKLHGITIKFPLAIHVGQMQDPKTGEVKNINQVVPWAMNIKEEEVTITKSVVVYVSEANNELQDMWRKATSRIQTAPQGIQLPK